MIRSAIAFILIAAAFISAAEAQVSTKKLQKASIADPGEMYSTPKPASEQRSEIAANFKVKKLNPMLVAD